MTVNTQELRELVAGLPLVGWSKSGSTVQIPETEDFAGKQLPITGLDKQYARRLAAYIAAANPLAVSALLDEIDRLSAALAERDWQPIEAAPHDEEVLLGWAEWDGAWKAEVAMASWGWKTDRVSNISRHGRATHWQPLAEPPKGS